MLGALLKLSTVYGEKLDDTVIVDKKKMRRDFGVVSIIPLTNNQELYLRLLTLSLNQTSPHSRATSFEARVNTVSQNDISEEMGDESKGSGTPGKFAVAGFN
jgi:hypothetical protein